MQLLRRLFLNLKLHMGTVLGYDVQMHHFYMVHMEKNEKVQGYSTRMEGSLNQIQVKFPGMISNAEAEIKLRDKLFYGVHKTLRDSIRYLYDNPAVICTVISCS